MQNCRSDPANRTPEGARSMSNEKPDPVPPFPMDDDRSVGFHVAMGTLDAATSLVPGASYGVQQLVRQFIRRPLRAWTAPAAPGPKSEGSRRDEAVPEEKSFSLMG